MTDTSGSGSGSAKRARGYGAGSNDASPGTPRGGTRSGAGQSRGALARWQSTAGRCRTPPAPAKGQPKKQELYSSGEGHLVLEVNGLRHPLDPPGFLIGRGTDADLRINDPGISRNHAQIRVSGSNDSLQIDIVDLGSTNGIVVNGQKVRHAVLGEGSRIEIGSTRMLVHAPSGR